MVTYLILKLKKNKSPPREGGTPVPDVGTQSLVLPSLRPRRSTANYSTTIVESGNLLLTNICGERCNL